MSDDRINELEHRLIETSQSEMQREKKKEDIEQSIQELWGHFKRCHLCMVLEYQKEKQEQGRKKYLKLILVYVLAQLCLALCEAHQDSLSITISRSLLKLMSIEEVMPSNHPLSSPSPPAFNLSQHQGLFQWVSSSHQVTKVLELQPQHQSLQWIFRIDFL